MLADDIKKVEYYVDFGGPHNNIADAWSRIKTALEESQKTPTNKQNVPLEYDDWMARPCARYDSCPVKNKNLHCYANKPCFK